MTEDRGAEQTEYEYKSSKCDAQGVIKRVGAAKCKDEKTEHKYSKGSEWAVSQAENKLWLPINMMRHVKNKSGGLIGGVFNKSNFWKKCKLSVIGVF